MARLPATLTFDTLLPTTHERLKMMIRRRYAACRWAADFLAACFFSFFSFWVSEVFWSGILELFDLGFWSFHGFGNMGGPAGHPAVHKRRVHMACYDAQSTPSRL